MSEQEPNTCTARLASAGYTTGFWGKYLNSYGGSHAPVGWDHWVGLQGNSRYHNYTLVRNGVLEPHGGNYQLDYLTDLVGNESSVWLAKHLAQRPPLANPAMCCGTKHPTKTGSCLTAVWLVFVFQLV